MRLYITVNRPIPSGYIGLDLAQQKIDFDNMDSICEPAECTEIIVEELASYVQVDKLGALLQKIISRLRKRGTFIIKDVDVNEATKKYLNGLLNINDLNFLLFSKGNLTKCGAYSVHDIRGVIEALGLEVVSIDLTDCYYNIKAQRK